MKIWSVNAIITLVGKNDQSIEQASIQFDVYAEALDKAYDKSYEKLSALDNIKYMDVFAIEEVPTTEDEDEV